MRRIITPAGLIIIIAAFAVAWTTTSLERTPTPRQATAGEASATMLPFELMLRHGASLPHEHWKHAF